MEKEGRWKRAQRHQSSNIEKERTKMPSRQTGSPPRLERVKWQKRKKEKTLIYILTKRAQSKAEVTREALKSQRAGQTIAFGAPLHRRRRKPKN
ncbi:hypothetical protein V6N13_097206 [Hibiscus sabdariffa]